MAHSVRRLECESIDLAIPNPSIANPPAIGNRQGFRTYAFDSATAESLFIEYRLPQSYIAGDGVVFCLDFMVATPPGADAGVVWKVEYKKISAGDVFDFSVGTAVVAATVPVLSTISAYEDLRPASPLAFTTTGWQPLDLLVMRLYRDPADAGDDYANDALLHNIMLGYYGLLEGK